MPDHESLNMKYKVVSEQWKAVPGAFQAEML
jgi:hypothetical protein